MKTGNLKITCPKCSSSEFAKDGKRTMSKNKNPLQQYKCKSCKHRFTSNAFRKTYRQRKPELNNQIMNLYCEGNTLRGISRLLKISYNTVVSKFRFMANLARDFHLKSIQEKEIITKYVQFDEMISFEKSKQNKLGIELAIRPKTFQILSARVCEIPSNQYKERVSKIVDSQDREIKMTDMMLEVEKCLSQKYSVISCDGAYINKKIINKICPDSLQEINVRNYAGMWRLNHMCGKLRQRISRLQRKTWATTKDRKFLQMHLDLYIAFQNNYKLSF